MPQRNNLRPLSGFCLIEAAWFEETFWILEAWSTIANKKTILWIFGHSDRILFWNKLLPILLWESFKAYIRGCFISYQSSQKKRNNQKQTDLEELIWKLHAENAAQRSTEKYNQISALKYQLNTLISEKNSKAFTSTEQTFLNSGINLISGWQDNCQRGKVIGLFIR